MQWAIVIAAFLAASVEFVEAFTLVLVAGVTINWRSSIVGALAAVATLAVIIATLGVALVILVGSLVRAPLQRIPENTLKFIVGIMLTTFGTFWAGESFGINWPFSDLFLLLLAALYLIVSALLITAMKRRQPRVASATTASEAPVLSQEKEVRICI